MNVVGILTEVVIQGKKRNDGARAILMSHLLARFLLYALHLLPTSDSVQQWASNTPPTFGQI